MIVELERYNDTELKIIEKYFIKLAKTTRKSGKISKTVKEKLLKKWIEFDINVVIDSLNAYIDKEIAITQQGKGINENYTLGIMKNKQKTKGCEKNGSYIRNDTGNNATRNKGKSGEQESERIYNIAKSNTQSAIIECDF
jgi:hypothetical protein